MTAQNRDRGGKTVRAALYCRVSTAVGQNPEMQVRELREFAERRGWKIAGEYIDTGVSGAKDSRPELNRLMADAHRRRFDAVIVWKFDRFARSVSHLLKGLETFRALGDRICFVIRAGGYDDANGKDGFHGVGSRGGIGAQLDC